MIFFFFLKNPQEYIYVGIILGIKKREGLMFVTGGGPLQRSNKELDCIDTQHSTYSRRRKVRNRSSLSCLYLIKSFFLNLSNFTINFYVLDLALRIKFLHLSVLSFEKKSNDEPVSNLCVVQKKYLSDRALASGKKNFSYLKRKYKF